MHVLYVKELGKCENVGIMHELFPLNNRTASELQVL